MKALAESERILDDLERKEMCDGGREHVEFLHHALRYLINHLRNAPADGKATTCIDCRGTKRVKERVQGTMDMGRWVECRTCKGRGTTDAHPADGKAERGEGREGRHMNITPEQLERLGELADTAANLRASANMPMPLHIHVAGLKGGMAAIRDELRALVVAIGGENPWEHHPPEDDR